MASPNAISISATVILIFWDMPVACLKSDSIFAKPK